MKWEILQRISEKRHIDRPKNKLLDCYIKSVVSYGCETRTFNKEIIQRPDALQLWCYRKMLKIKYVTNEKVKKMLGVKQRWSEELAKRKLRFAGHKMRQLSSIGSGRNYWREERQGEAKKNLGWWCKRTGVGAGVLEKRRGNLEYVWNGRPWCTTFSLKMWLDDEWSELKMISSR